MIIAHSLMLGLALLDMSNFDTAAHLQHIVRNGCVYCTGSFQLHVMWSCGYGKDVCWIRCGTDHGPHHGSTFGQRFFV